MSSDFSAGTVKFMPMETLLQTAIEAAREAGALILKYYKSSYEIQEKGYHNPVTTADHAADARLKKILQAAEPEFGWLSEETVDSMERLSKSKVWVVDPLDGTKEFIEGVPNFVVSIALVENGVPVLGVLFNPVTHETFTAIKHGGAFLNNQPIHCSEKSVPADMTIYNSRSETRRGLWNPYQEKFAQLEAVGSVAYKLGLTAAGKADVFASLRPKHEWDVCAGHCIINEAGGKMVTTEGREVTYNNESTLITPGLVAGFPGAVDATLKLIREHTNE